MAFLIKINIVFISFQILKAPASLLRKFSGLQQKKLILKTGQQKDAGSNEDILTICP